MFCSNQLSNYRLMDLSGPGIDVELKERKKEKLQNHSFLNFEFCFLAKVFGQENKCQFHPSSQNVSCYVSHRNANFIPEPQWEGPRERVLVRPVLLEG